VSAPLLATFSSPPVVLVVAFALPGSQRGGDSKRGGGSGEGVEARGGGSGEGVEAREGDKRVRKGVESKVNKFVC